MSLVNALARETHGRGWIFGGEAWRRGSVPSREGATVLIKQAFALGDVPVVLVTIHTYVVRISELSRVPRYRLEHFAGGTQHLTMSNADD
jgi:hypothetical protein